MQRSRIIPVAVVLATVSGLALASAAKAEIVGEAYG